MTTADQIARHLRQIQARGAVALTAPAVRKAKAHAQRIANAALSLDFETLAALLNEVPQDAAAVALLVHIAALKGASNHQRNAAQAKNANARGYVLKAWAARPEGLESKAAWARRYVQIVLRKFKTRIEADTISRDWLPKGEPSAAVPIGATAWTGRFHAPRKP